MKIKKKDLLNRIKMLEYKVQHLNLYDVISNDKFVDDKIGTIVGKFMADIAAEKQKPKTVNELEAETKIKDEHSYKYKIEVLTAQNNVLQDWLSKFELFAEKVNDGNSVFSGYAEALLNDYWDVDI